MTTARVLRASVALAGLLLALPWGPGPAHAQRVAAELGCVATAERLVYDCTVRLRRGGQPLDGVTVTVSADMPTMPMAHNVRPLAARPGTSPGEYRARLALEMYGEWAVKLRLDGPVRDLIVVHQDFQETGAAPASAGRGHHRQ
jgi:hypothetical protein